MADPLVDLPCSQIYCYCRHPCRSFINKGWISRLSKESKSVWRDGKSVIALQKRALSTLLKALILGYYRPGNTETE